ncbi:MAG: pitrilysin family protein [Bacteroidota bacterium]|nr:pitrilysin family protein [Bacteroidota bacterium]
MKFLKLAIIILMFIFINQIMYSKDLGIKKKVLKNGLEILVAENSAVPLITVEICVKNGAFAEPPEYSGLSHLYEHMFFKANEKLPNQEAFLERGRELGMVWNGTTGNERVNYFFTCPKTNLEEAIEYMRDATMYPLFDQTELEKERPVVIGEYDRAESQPPYHLFVALNKKTWGEYYNRKNAIGERSTLLAATQEQMKTIQKKFYIPNNSSLLIAGDVKAEEVYKLVEKYFGKWEKGEDPFIKNPPVTFKPIEKPETIILEKEFPIVVGIANFHGPDTKRDIAGTHAADVFSYIINQKTSNFQKALVESGLMVGLNFGYQTEHNVGPIMFVFQTMPDKLKDAVKALSAEIEKFDSPDYYTDDQIETAKNLLAVEEIYGRESTSSWIHTVSYWWASAGLNYYENYIKDLKKVTRKDISDFVRKYIKGKNYVIGVLISEDNVKTLDLKGTDLLLGTSEFEKKGK